MAPVVQAPLNTMLADLDASLRTLLGRELSRHGFDGVEIAFDAPSREWSGQLSRPTVDLFLYDLREAEQPGHSDYIDEPRRSVRPPLRIEASYAVTAWTQAVEDEHRLLSQVLSILFAFDTLPEDVLDARLRDGSQRFPLEASIGKPRGDKSDFWSAVGGQYKASLEYVVRLAAESGTHVERGPEVRTQVVRTRARNGSTRTLEETSRHGGTVRDAAGEPVADAWVALPQAGAFATTGPDGRFVFQRVRPGRHPLVVRTRTGGERKAELQVPGAPLDLVV